MLLDRFKELVAQSSLLTMYIDNIRMVEGPEGSVWTIGYLFDGHMDCAVIFDGKLYYDLQDINIAESVWDCHGSWRRAGQHESLDSLVKHIEAVLSQGV